MTIEDIAIAFHEAYEAQSKAFGWETQEASRVPWSMVPEANRGLMRSVIGTLIERGVISPGGADLELGKLIAEVAEIEAIAHRSLNRHWGESVTTERTE